VPQEHLVYPVVAAQLRVEDRGEEPLTCHEDRLAAPGGADLHARARPQDARRSDEQRPEGAVEPPDVEVGLERRDLPSVVVTSHRDVEQPEARLVREPGDLLREDYRSRATAPEPAAAAVELP